MNHSRSFVKTATARRTFHWRSGAAARLLAGIAIASAAATGAAHAASATFNPTPANNNFGNGANWSTGAAPGVNDGTTINTDTATFSAALTNAFGTAASPLLIDMNRNLQNITFSGATASAYVIGTTSGNPLLLTSGGTISSAAANIETVNAPLVLEPASATTAGTYTFSSNAASATNVLNFGGPITLGATTAATTLNLTGTNTGANTLSGTVSDTGTGGLILNKTGTGAWTFGGNGTSTLAKGNITEAAGTFNFGSATDTPTLNINGTTGSNVGVFVRNASNFNMSGGSLSVANSQGLVLDGTNTYNQTRGAFSTNGLVEFANGSTGAVSTVNISGGTLTTTSANANDATDLAVRGTTTVNLSGTGTFTTPTLNMTTSQLTSGTASSTFNLLSGGTLVVGRIINGTGGPTGAGTTFNFNGGTLRASASSTTFMQGLTTANVQAGGAVINTNGFSDTIGQTLVASTTSPGGGLTKLGAGTLTLSGTAANTYTGGTTITAGTLAAAKDGALGSGNVSVGSNGVLTLTGGTTNNYIGDVASLILTGTSNANPFVNLNFTGTDIIGNLSFDGGMTFAQAGTYGAVGSGALFTNSDFSGTGILSNTGLAAAPEPSQYAAFAVGLLGLGALALKARKRTLAA